MARNRKEKTQIKNLLNILALITYIKTNEKSSRRKEKN
jgi:hypothetical protein